MSTVLYLSGESAIPGRNSCSEHGVVQRPEWEVQQSSPTSILKTRKWHLTGDTPHLLFTLLSSFQPLESCSVQQQQQSEAHTALHLNPCKALTQTTPTQSDDLVLLLLGMLACQHSTGCSCLMARCSMASFPVSTLSHALAVTLLWGNIRSGDSRTES